MSFSLQLFGQITWTQVTPAGSSTKNWTASAINSDGSIMLAGIKGKRLYISTDSGSNWSETAPAGDSDQNWQTASMSSDGSILIAGAYGGRLYLSLNGGNEWNEIAPHGESTDKYWKTTSMSSDGTKIIAGVEGGRLYISTDSGENWDETAPAGNASKSWYAIAMSGDGSKIIAGVWGEWLYISTNGGSNWDVTDPMPDDEDKNKNWSTTSMSSDGSRIVAGVYSERLFISENLGDNWIESQPAGDFDFNWNTTAISGDGNIILAGVFNGKVYVSSDGNISWSETTLPTWYYATSAISTDGSKAIVGSSPSGRLWVNTSPLPVELISFTGELIGNEVLLEWKTAIEVNNYGFEVVRKNGGNGEWEKIGFVQGHGTTNSPKEYSFTDDLTLNLNPNLTQVSYRLKQIDLDGTFAYSKIVTVDLTSITSVDEIIVYEFALEQNYPNPFNPTTTIKFTIPSLGDENFRPLHTQLVVYDILGREVATLINKELQPGIHQVSFNALNLPSGVYFYKLITNEFMGIKKMLLLR